MGKRELDRVRKIALTLPEVTERVSHGALCFFVRDKLPLCYFHDDHRGDGRVSLWCRALVGVQEELVRASPARFFKPQTSRSGAFRDWLGVFLDVPNVDWDEITALLEDSYCTVAPKRFVAEFCARHAGSDEVLHSKKRDADGRQLKPHGHTRRGRF